MLNFVLNPPNFKISCFFPFINDFRETDGDWLHRFIYLFAALSVCVQRNLKRLNHMNAPSVSVPQPPADFSCCILRQTALYLLELKLTMLQHAHEMLLKKNVQTKLEKAKESKFPSLCLSPAQQHTITTTPPTSLWNYRLHPGGPNEQEPGYVFFVSYTISWSGSTFSL